MPEYTFTGAYPRVLAGLSQGVNASLTAAVGESTVWGSTLEAAPGDHVRTDEPYDHAELAVVVPEPQPVNADGSPIPTPEPAPVDPAPVPAPEPDPAHDTMTAEGAPAPAEPTA